MFVACKNLLALLIVLLKTHRYIIYTTLTYFVYSNVPLCFCYYVLFCVYFRHLPFVYVNVVQLSHRYTTVWY